MSKEKMFPKLFERGRIGTLELKNRVFKSAQHTALAARDGSVTDRLIRHYSELARGGAALVCVEYTYVDNKGSKATRCQLGISDHEYIPGLSLLAQAIQSNGAKAALQITHAGGQKHMFIPPLKAPSPIPFEGLYHRVGEAAIPQELKIQEITEIVGAFGDAARRAQLAGFDMVEIQGCHGYLITSFLSPRTNKREDRYGGTLENRMKFLLEIIKDVRGKVGSSLALSVRLSASEYEPDGIKLEDTIEISRALENTGVDVIHVSGGNQHRGIYIASPMGMPLGLHIWAAEAIKKAVNIPVIASGSITTPGLAEDLLNKDKADFVALSRSLWADPYWPQKAKEGRPEDIRPCIRCDDGCQYRGGELSRANSCTVNVAMGREAELAITPAQRAQKVAVIGGGPAGMEAAIVCALRGHKVTLFEKRKLGGAMLEASVPEFKSDLRRLIEYYQNRIKQLGIDVIYKEVTAAVIKDGGFGAVIVATGGTPIKLEVPGIAKPIVTGALAVLGGKTQVGHRVIVVGGGLVGTELGLYLAEQGKEVIFIEMTDKFMVGVGTWDRVVFEERMSKRKVTIHTGKRLQSVLDNGVVVIDKAGKTEEISGDSVVLAVGFAPQASFSEKLRKELDIEVYEVGDCVSPRRIYDAIHEGHYAARWL